jgi:DNA polymerase (family 10)
MDNADVARLLNEIADLMELLEGNPFKVRAYRQAALTVSALPGSVAEFWKSGVLTSLTGIGESMARRIGEFLETGRMHDHDELAKKIPPGLLDLLHIEGVGPKTAALVWKELGIKSIAQLEKAALSGRLLKVPRMGEQRIKSLLDSIQRHKRRSLRVPLHRALTQAEAILEQMRTVPGVTRAEVAGSVRRRKETVGDLDILVASQRPQQAIDAFTQLPIVAEVLAKGPTRAAVQLRSGMHADLRVLSAKVFGAGLHYFTGSQAHSIALRTRAVRKGLKISEYGVFDAKDRLIGGAKEEDIYRLLGLPWIPPELRENSGEIEAAERGELPELIEPDDIVGDLHVHSEASPDGHASLLEIATEGRRLGRHYIAITDHSKSRPAGLDAVATLDNAGAVREFRRTHRSRPKLLTGTEVDILWNGGLDLPTDVLDELDWVVASIHSRFRDPVDVTTERLIRAMRSGVIDCIGHPTGRLLGSRDPYLVDLERILEVAAEEGVALEVNAQPERLDLNDRMCRMAKNAGVKVVINSDAHTALQLRNTLFGVWMARRGWLTADDVLNTTDIPSRRRRAGRHLYLHQAAMHREATM